MNARHAEGDRRPWTRRRSPLSPTLLGVLERILALARGLADASGELDRLGHATAAGQVRAGAVHAARAVRRLVEELETAKGSGTRGEPTP